MSKAPGKPDVSNGFLLRPRVIHWLVAPLIGVLLLSLYLIARSWQAIYFNIASLAVVGVMALVIYQLYRRYVFANGLAIENARVNEKLKKEVAEREKTEADLTRLSEELGRSLKELNCLYGIERLVSKPGITLKEILVGIASLIPQSMRVPEQSRARIVFGEKEIASGDFQQTPYALISDIYNHDRKEGAVEVYYLKEKPDETVETFTVEEKKLIETISALTTRAVERKLAEEEIGLFHSLMDQSNDALFIVDLETGKFMAVNQVACTSLGYEWDELLGKCVWDIQHALGDENAWREHTTRLCETGAMYMEGEHVRKDGSRFPVEVSLRVYESESRTYVIAVARDITSRKNFEDSLQAELCQSQKLINTIPNPVFHEDLKGRLLKCNDAFARFIGMDRESLIGKLISEFAPSELAELCEANSREILATGERRAFEAATVDCGGTRHDYVISAAPYIGDEGNLTGFVGIITDISERKCAEKVLQDANNRLEEMNEKLKGSQNQLVQSEKMASIGQLAAGVAHEINNPVGFVKSNLGTLTGYVSTFKDLFHHYDILTEAVRNGDGAKQSETIREVVRISKDEDLEYILEDIGCLLNESIDGTERVRDIVQNLKSFARIDDTHIKEADLNEGIEATLKIVWNELKYKTEVHKKLGPLPSIKCNAGQLNQVFMNMLLNAVQAIPEKGEITIESWASDKDVFVKIRDNGSGMTEETRKKLFDPFYTTKPAGKGTGLGLSISLGIVQKHNGVIDVESELGKGTSFTIRLPVTGVTDE